MCMIYDRCNDKILVLDKKKKYGWEGLTFVGGHVESGETIYESCVREVFEETGLNVENLVLKGTVSWFDKTEDKRWLGFLYYTENFTGEIVVENREGTLHWMAIDELKESDNKSETIDEILELYLNKDISELFVLWENGQFVESRFL